MLYSSVFLLYICCVCAVFDIGDNDDIHEAGGGRVASERLPLPTFSCEHHIHQVNDYDEYDCYDDYDDNDGCAVRAGQKFYTLKVSKSDLFVLTMEQCKCINISN